MSLLLHPYAQTKMAGFLTHRLSQSIPENVSIRQIRMPSLNQLAFDELYIEDHHQDTLLYVQEMKLNYNLIQLVMGKYKVEKVRLNRGVFKLKRYENEDVLNVQHFLAEWQQPEDTTLVYEEDSNYINPTYLNLQELSLEQFRFEHSQPFPRKNQSSFDANHINSIIQLAEFENIDITEQHISLHAEKLELIEKSGLEFVEFTSDIFISSYKMGFSNTRLKTPSSDVEVSYEMQSKDYSSYNHFGSEIINAVSIQSANISSNDLRLFLPKLKANKMYQVEGEISGPLKNIKGKNIRLYTTSQSSFAGDLSIKGLPNIDETFLFIDVEEFTTNRRTVEDIVNQFSTKKERIELPSELDRLGTIHYHGNLTGFIKDFVAYGTLTTKLGSFKSDISIDSKQEIPAYKGHLATEGFQAGAYLQQDNSIGDVAFELDIEGKGFTKTTVKANAKGIVHQFDLYGQRYQNIAINGLFSDQQFTGDLTVHDPNIDFNFIGAINLKDSLKNLTFLAEINHIKPAYFYPKGNFDSSAVVSTTMNIDITGSSVDNFIGSMDFYNTEYKDTARHDEIALFNLTASSENEIKLLSIKSDLMHLQVEGKYKFKNLKNNVLTIVDHYIPFSIDESGLQDSPDDFDFTGEINHSGFLSRIFIPGFEIDSGTIVKGHFNVQNRSVDLSIVAPGIDYGNTRFDSVNVNVHADGINLNTSLSSSQIAFGKDRGLDNFNWNINAVNNKIDNSIQWDDLTGSNKGDIGFEIDFLDIQKFGLNVQSSYFIIEDSVWNIADSGSINVDKDDINTSNLGVYSALSSIDINGSVSKNPKDTLFVQVNQLNLDYFQTFMPKSFQFKGILDGEMTLSDVYEDFLFTSNITIDSTQINEYQLGNGALKSLWNHEKKAMEMSALLGFDSIKHLEITGDYTPKSIRNQLDFSIRLKELQLNIIQPFVSDVLSNLTGKIDAELTLTGMLKRPETNGICSLTDANVTIDYTNVSYRLMENEQNSLNFSFYPEYFIAQNVTMLDDNNQSASGVLKFSHDHFKKFDYDIQIQPEKLLLLDTDSKDNELYYGNVFGTGTIHVFNRSEITHLKLDLETENNSEFFLPMSESGEVNERGFVRFTSIEQSKETVEEAITSNVSDYLNFEMDLKVGTGTEFQIVFDELVGDVIRCTGEGELSMEMKPNESFSIIGEYELEKGDYLFTLQNIINKRFLIQKGGIIRWDGDPYKGVLDLTAIYKLRTKLDPIMGNTLDSSSYKKRVPVELLLSMENQVLEPEISFDVNLPTMDDETKSIVRNELSQPTCMNQQVFTLLILNQFTSCSTDPSNTGGSSNFGRTTTSEVLSNQLSNWLSKISDDFDIGFSYRPGDPNSEISDNEVELALSTQLLNDRIILDGNVGYTNSEQLNQDQNRSSDLVGEFTLQYKIREDGKLRVKAFNQVNDRNQLETTHQYTQGVGLYYIKEFDNLNDLLKRNQVDASQKKKSKRKKNKNRKNKQKDPALTGIQSKQNEENSAPEE